MYSQKATLASVLLIKTPRVFILSTFVCDHNQSSRCQCAAFEHPCIAALKMAEILSVYSNAFREDSNSSSSNQTDLFVAVHERQWEAALRLLASNPSEAREWSSRVAYDGEISWTRLPIHEACINNGPKHVIEALLQAYPKCCAAVDINNRLPLHYAAVHGAKFEILELLVRTCPGAVNSSDDYGKTPAMCVMPSATFSERDAFSKKMELLSKIYPGDPLVVFSAGYNSFEENFSSDENETSLFTAIKEKKWAEVRKLIESNAEEVREWTAHKDSDGEIAWRRLPIHEACINNAPSEVVEALLRKYKEGASMKDLNNRLPLHHAAIHGSSFDVFEFLIDSYPDSLEKEDNFGKTPVKCLRPPNQSDISIYNKTLEALSQSPNFYKDAVTDPRAKLPLKKGNDDVLALREKLSNERREKKKLNNELHNLLSQTEKMKGLMSAKNMENEHLKAALSNLQKEFKKLERDVFSQGSYISSETRNDVMSYETESLMATSMLSFDTKHQHPIDSINLKKDRNLQSLRAEVKERENKLGKALMRARSPVQFRE